MVVGWGFVLMGPTLKELLANDPYKTGQPEKMLREAIACENNPVMKKLLANMLAENLPIHMTDKRNEQEL